LLSYKKNGETIDLKNKRMPVIHIIKMYGVIRIFYRMSANVVSDFQILVYL